MEDALEISRSLGNMEGKVDTLLRHTTTLFNKFDNLNVAQIEQAGQIKLLATQIIDHKTDDVKVHKIVSDMKTEFEAKKNQGKGLAIGMTLIGGTGTIAGIAAAIKTFFLTGMAGPPPGAP